MNYYVLGVSVKVSATFKDLAGVVFDPSTVACIIQKPDGTETTYTYGVGTTIVKVSTGVYYLWLATTQVDRWSYRWKGTGTQSVANEGSFGVTKSTFVAP